MADEDTVADSGMNDIPPAPDHNLFRQNSAK